MNVALTDRYTKLSARLRQTLKLVGDTTPVLQWLNCLPPDAPKLDMPFGAYCAKPFAMLEAVRAGFDAVLWLDAAYYAVRHPAPLFAHIERVGHYVQGNGFFVGEWSSDYALAKFGVGRESAFGIPELSASALGLNMAHEDSQRFLQAWAELAADGKTFIGAHANECAMETVKQRGFPFRTIGPVSQDPRVMGHRHDQTAASLLAWKLGWELTPRPVFCDYWKQEQDERVLFVNKGDNL